MVEMHLQLALLIDRREVMTMAASPERHRGFLRRAPRDSQDSLISSPLMGSQAAVFATLGGSLSICFPFGHVGCSRCYIGFFGF